MYNAIKPKGHSIEPTYRYYLNDLRQHLLVGWFFYFLKSPKMNKNEKAFSPIDYEMNVKIIYIIGIFNIKKR